MRAIREGKATITPTLELAAVVGRLENLEREVLAEKLRKRWLLAAAGIAAVGFVLAWTLANTTTAAQAQGGRGGPKVIRAARFFLEDENGESRAAPAVGKDGPRLALADDNGKTIWSQP